MALLIGLILSAVISGQIVSRTGRYKALLVGSLGIMAVGLALLTQLRADTDLPVLWFWMFVTGVGIGPSFSVFTIIVQNAVPFRVLGVATSNLTFFRQIGGVVGLAIASTILGTSLREELPGQLVAKGIPEQYAQLFAQNFGKGGSNVTGVGVDLGKQLASVLPAQAQPFIPNIVDGIHGAFALAVASTFAVGIVAGLVAIVAAVFIEEIPLREHAGPETAVAAAPAEISRRRLAEVPVIE